MTQTKQQQVELCITLELSREGLIVGFGSRRGFFPTATSFCLAKSSRPDKKEIMQLFIYKHLCVCLCLNGVITVSNQEGDKLQLASQLEDHCSSDEELLE